MKWIYTFWDWLKPTLSGPDGKASHRKIAVLHFTLLLTWMVYKTASGSVFQDIAWITVAGGAGLLSGLSVWQSKVNKEKDYNIEDYENDISNSRTSQQRPRSSRRTL